jgi:hypothetical protein
MENQSRGKTNIFDVEKRADQYFFYEGDLISLCSLTQKPKYIRTLEGVVCYGFVAEILVHQIHGNKPERCKIFVSGVDYDLLQSYESKRGKTKIVPHTYVTFDNPLSLTRVGEKTYDFDTPLEYISVAEFMKQKVLRDREDILKELQEERT